MNTNQYELDLLVEAIASSLTKVKRKRGECNKLTMIPPITKDIPDYFKEAKDITDEIKKGDFGK